MIACPLSFARSAFRGSLAYGKMNIQCVKDRLGFTRTCCLSVLLVGNRQFDGKFVILLSMKDLVM